MSLLRKLSHIDQSYANFRRYLEIIDALFVFGFGDLFAGVPEGIDHPKSRWNLLRFRRRGDALARSRTRPERVRMLLETLGPTFVKLGQVLASRPDMIPAEYVRELTRLQDKVPGFPWEEARKIIESELKRPITDCFRSIDPEPFAAASIGQVHHAVLPDGTEVVVKVQRPGIERKVAIDLEIMYHLATRLEHTDLDLAQVKPTRIVEEFSHVLTRELNYVVEATHARRFAIDMAHQPGIFVPKVYEHLSSMRVLTMERVPGHPADTVLAQPELRQQFDLKLLAKYGADAMMAQIFTHGFFHADPHPGNIFFLEGNRLCFIDFGMMGRVSEQERGDFVRTVQVILRRDHQRLVRCVLRLSTQTGIPPNLMLLERDLGDLVEENLYLPLEKISLARILEQLMRTITFHRLVLRPDLYVMFKALITIETLARRLDPDLQIMEILQSAMHQARWRMLSLKRRRENLVETLTDLEELANELPYTTEILLNKLQKGELSFRLEHHGLLPLRETLRIAFNRLAYAVVLAALIIGSSLIVLAKEPPLWSGIPVIGIVGFVASALMGFGMLFRAIHKPPES